MCSLLNVNLIWHLPSLARSEINLLSVYLSWIKSLDPFDLLEFEIHHLWRMVKSNCHLTGGWYSIGVHSFYVPQTRKFQASGFTLCSAQTLTLLDRTWRSLQKAFILVPGCIQQPPKKELVRYGIIWPLRPIPWLLYFPHMRFWTLSHWFILFQNDCQLFWLYFSKSPSCVWLFPEKR